MSGLCLLVDDEPIVLAYMKAVLRRQGFQTLESSTGSGALALIREHGNELDLVVSDVQMEGVNGIAVMREVNDSFPSVPVILVSGCVDLTVETQTEARFRFLRKPFVPDALIGIVREVLPPRKSGAPLTK